MAVATLASRFPHLKALLSSTSRSPDALNFEQLLGFLYAVSSAPDVVDVSEWLRFVFDGEAHRCEDRLESERVVHEAMDLFHAINCQVFECRCELPPECLPRADVLANLDPECGLSRWAQGFSLGHDWLEEAWEASVRTGLDEDLDWQLGGCMAVLCFFSSPEMARALHAEFSTDAGSLEERARVMLDLLPEALNAYADIGRCLATGMSSDEDEGHAGGAAVFAVSAVSADSADSAPADPSACRCGSGQPFLHCCGASRMLH